MVEVQLFDDKRLAEITSNISLPIYNAIKFAKLIWKELGKKLNSTSFTNL
jgi:hypothetical protein